MIASLARPVMPALKPVTLPPEKTVAEPLSPPLNTPDTAQSEHQSGGTAHTLPFASRPLLLPQVRKNTDSNLRDAPSSPASSQVPAQRIKKTRAERVKEKQHKALVDTHDKNAIKNAMFALPGKISTGIAKLDWPRSQQAETNVMYIHLRNKQITLHPDSNLRLNGEPMAGKTVSVEQCILANGWILPKNNTDIENLAKALHHPPLQSAPYGDFGGGLSWSAPPLSQEIKKDILSSVMYNSMKLKEFQSLRPSKDALGFLAQSKQWSPAELSDPRAFLANLIKTPEAQALGKALQAQFKGASSSTSIDDWAMTAIAIGIDEKSISAPDKSANKVAGFDLLNPDLGGKPLHEVVKALTKHVAIAGARADDLAPVRAYALLTRQAPELLVKEVPNSVTYGSSGWISLKTAVARIEAQAPGQSSSMKYAEIMQYASVPPITTAEEQIEQQASLEAMTYWAINNGVIKKNDNNRYTGEQIEQVRAKAKERFIALDKASSAKDIALHTREELTDKMLKEKYGAGINFREKCIWPVENWNHLKGPYSVIDLIHSDNFLDKSFRSTNKSIPLDAIHRDRFDAYKYREAFENQFTHYYEAQKTSTTTAIKHLISQLPRADREHLEYGALNIYQKTDVTRSLRSDRYLNLPLPKKYIKHATQEKNNRGLFIETRHNNEVRHYEINPQQGLIRPTKDFKAGLQSEWRKLPPEYNNPFSGNSTDSNKEVIEIAATDELERHQRKAAKKTDAPLQSFSSSRTQYIAQRVTNNLFPAAEAEQLFKQTKGLTTLDTEVTDFEKIQTFTRSVIPFASATESFSKGKTQDGVNSLALDIFGFLFVGAKTVGGISRLAGRAGSLGSKIKPGASLLTRALASGANPFSGGKALLSGGVKLLDSAVSLANKGIHYLRGGANSADLFRHIKKSDLIEGSIKTANNAEPLKLTAKFDKSGVLYAYDPKTKNLFGPPLENFKANKTSSENLQKNITQLHKKMDTEVYVCYDYALMTGMADKQLSRNTFDTVKRTLKSVDGKSNYSQSYLDIMGINPQSTKKLFNPDDITESGIINFKHTNGDKNFHHTIYIQKTNNNELIIYNINDYDLASTMLKTGQPLKTSGGMSVFRVDGDYQKGMQNFLDNYAEEFAYTPASALSANVARLAS